MHVMNGMREVLAETNHAMIFHKINKLLPKLFGFKKTAILLMQAHAFQLYNIAYENEEALQELARTKSYSDQNVFSYPANLGLTGIAIANKEVFVSNKGQNDQKFAPEVDNFCGAGHINNMMIGPLMDLNGKVRGVIQLFNKISFGFANEADTNGIVKKDMTELNSICLGLGEVIKTADQYYDFEK